MVQARHFTKRTILFVFLFQSTMFSWNLTPGYLARNLEKALPVWMEKRIEADFLFFKNGFSSSDIAACLEKLKGMQGIEKAGLVRILFENGRAEIEPLFPLTPKETASLGGFISALEALDRAARLPQLLFLLTVAPSFNRPLLLNQTTIPVFAVSKERHNSKAILIPRLWNPDREETLQRLFSPWETKIGKAFYRGRATDGPYGFFDWDFRPRAQLALRASRHPDLIDAYLVPSPDLNEYYTHWLSSLRLLAAASLPSEQTAYKYLLTLDGAASPSSFEWELTTHSLIFKTQSNRIEWFYDALKPDEHFIQIRPDSADLVEKILWAKANDREAKAIAERSYRFGVSTLTDEQALAYLYRVLSAYARHFKNM